MRGRATSSVDGFTSARPIPGCDLVQLADQAHLQAVRQRNSEEREWLAARLRDRGIAIAPSQTNFLLADFARSAAPLESALVQRGVVLRPMIGYGLPTCLRITVGTRQDNLQFLKTLEEVSE